jgi:large subunit ribosomal protein L30
MTSYFRIVQIRSAIGLPHKTRGVLHALGLKKRLSIVYHPVSPDVAGQIMKVKELVDVEEVDTPMTWQEIRQSRRPDPGFYIERTVGDQTQ